MTPYDESNEKTLAFLLALALIGTSGVFSTLHVSATENKEAKEPQVVSKTDTSITLQTQENLEYALQVKDEKTDTIIWKWVQTINTTLKNKLLYSRI